MCCTAAPGGSRSCHARSVLDQRCTLFFGTGAHAAAGAGGPPSLQEMLAGSYAQQHAHLAGQRFPPAAGEASPFVAAAAAAGIAVPTKQCRTCLIERPVEGNFMPALQVRCTAAAERPVASRRKRLLKRWAGPLFLQLRCAQETDSLALQVRDLDGISATFQWDVSDKTLLCTHAGARPAVGKLPHVRSSFKPAGLCAAGEFWTQCMAQPYAALCLHTRLHAVNSAIYTRSSQRALAK
jgi:hypothetical protein